MLKPDSEDNSKTAVQQGGTPVCDNANFSSFF